MKTSCFERFPVQPAPLLLAQPCPAGPCHHRMSAYAPPHAMGRQMAPALCRLLRSVPLTNTLPVLYLRCYCAKHWPGKAFCTVSDGRQAIGPAQPFSLKGHSLAQLLLRPFNARAFSDQQKLRGRSNPAWAPVLARNRPDPRLPVLGTAGFQPPNRPNSLEGVSTSCKSGPSASGWVCSHFPGRTLDRAGECDCLHTSDPTGADGPAGRSAFLQCCLCLDLSV